jgi:excisionase family DNA binding protein
MTVPEAGWQYFGLSENGSYAAVRRGEIPVLRIGGHMRVSRQAMDEILRQAAAQTAPPEAAGEPTGLVTVA